jgi:hypothetical protein
MQQTSFTESKFATKKEANATRALPAEIEAATPFRAQVAALLQQYRKGDSRSRPPISLEVMLWMYIAQQCFGFVR